MAYEIMRGRLDEYRRWNIEKFGMRPSLKISCPGCGRTITIHNVELIDSDGTIRTPLVCPFNPCEFMEENVRLKSWDPHQLE